MQSKTRSTKVLTLVITTALVATAAMITSWPARQVQAIQDSEDFPTPFGLAQGQTARLTVLNTGDQQGYVTWKFLDSLGRTLAQTPEPHLIPPGQFRSFDFDLPNPPPGIVDIYGRIQVRALVSAIGNPDEKALRTSIEVLDNATGRTSFIIQSLPEPDRHE